MKRPNWSGLLRLGQVKSGQAMQSYLDLKIHIQHSTSYTEATYQISCQSSHRAQINTVDTQTASGHLNLFARHLHIETGISKSFKVPAIIFGTVHGDTLLMICAKYC